MMRRLVLAVTLLLSACASGSGNAPAPGVAASIAIAAPRSGDWTASYRFATPTRQLVFARSPDDSRVKTWHAPAGFEIVSTRQGEIARRTDGAAFAAVSFTMSPLYRELPKDYGPFSPFGDGGMLFHTGRFFACSQACPDDASWAMTLDIPDSRAILLDGKSSRHTARWQDKDPGRSIYIGAAKPVESRDVIAVIDTALPAAIHDQLDRKLPRFMAYYAGKLGRLTYKPMLFVSYDVSQKDGWGQQGGVLPGQVFMHFYGERWPAEMAKGDFATNQAWFFAHEAGHLYQRQIQAPADRDAWIHEGSAEAFAAIAVRADDPADAPYVAAKIAGAETACTKSLAAKSLVDAIDAGDFDAAYNCGLIIGLGIDAGVRAAHPDRDGLYAVWAGLIARAGESDRISKDDVFAVVAETGGQPLADAARKAVTTPAPGLDALRLKQAPQAK